MENHAIVAPEDYATSMIRISYLSHSTLNSTPPSHISKNLIICDRTSFFLCLFIYIYIYIYIYSLQVPTENPRKPPSSITNALHSRTCTLHRKILELQYYNQKMTSLNQHYMTKEAKRYKLRKVDD
jgi:hypothetical protein